MFEIKKDQLRELSDVQLPELVARLCEAELQKAALPVSAVQWGGAHTAPDGGLDVCCRVEAEDFHGDFVPRRFTGFQVKKSKMPPAKIAAEMAPKGKLRPIFTDLARAHGCYIIVSLDDDPTGEPLRLRHKALKDKLRPVLALGDLQCDFYGLAKLANWLRQHPAVQLWVRDALDIKLEGWKPFGRWTIIPPNDRDEFICKPGISVLLPGRETKPLDIALGIAGIRDLVRTSDKSVRIVGLSGVGKSRIVQALFEDSVGDDPLNKTLAIYADLSTEPIPSVRQVLDRLAIESHPAILVLDNCPADTHNRLAGQASATPDIRLITVEYDIREDNAEVTTVVRIEAHGPEIAETLILRRFPRLGHANARIIAEFSGGNARLALALADRVGDKDSLSNFSDEQLFEKLFFQRAARDEQLLVAAEILSIVYSYSVKHDKGGVDELATLAEIAGLKRLTLYRATRTLVDRQLAQERGRWQAVLPPAVSNRLAARALRNIPVDDIQGKIESLPDPRLLKSFAKRLGYLHDHEIAQSIVRSWLSPGGRLHDVDCLDHNDIQLLGHVAPVVPEAVLDAVDTRSRQADSEHFFSERNPRAPGIANLLFDIAYDAALFERSVALLAPFAIAEAQSQKSGSDISISRRLFALFWIHRSGTEAGLDRREKITRRFLFSEDPDNRQLGLGMLEAALYNGPFSFFGSFEFGARPRRSSGYQPRTFEEQNRWFQRFLALAHEVATGANGRQSNLTRDLLAKQFRGLWVHDELRSQLTRIAKSLKAQRPWLAGWEAIRSIKHHPANKLPDEAHGPDLLNMLDELLKPANLPDKIRTYVLAPIHIQLRRDDEFDCDDPNRIPASQKRAAVRACDLGEAVAGDPDIIGKLSEELFQTPGGYVLDFGKGMASSCPDPHALWTCVVEHLEQAGSSARSCNLLRGILEVIHQRNASLAEQILDEALQTRILRNCFVWLQLSIPLNSRAVQRLLDCLDFDDTPISQYSHIAQHHSPDALNETDLARILLKALDRPDGAEVVLDALKTRAPATKTDPRFSFGEDLSRVGLLAAARYLRSCNGHGGTFTDKNVRRVLTCSMNGASLASEIDDLLEAFFVAVKTRHGYIGDLEETAGFLISKAPHRFLDRVFLGEELGDQERDNLFSEQHRQRNLLSRLPPSILLDWCRQGEFGTRLGMISKAIYPFAKDSQNGDIVFSVQAHAILDASLDALETLTHFADFIHPLASWSGSLANIIAARRHPFELLLENERADVRCAAKKLISQIKNEENRVRDRERAGDQERDQRFE